jgi:hypothetical protein
MWRKMAVTRVQIGAKKFESDPVIGMFHNNRDCAVNLLKQHHAEQAMGERHGPKTQDFVGFGACFSRMPIGSANQKAQLPGARLRLRFDQFRKCLA